MSGAAARARAGTSVLSSSAVMAAGTVVSRLSGFVRSMLLAAALGTQLHADVFTIAGRTVWSFDARDGDTSQSVQRDVEQWWDRNAS